jgi:DMSO/TMAO reductase YedYZ molybdopterin-dependent catalytic subunit
MPTRREFLYQLGAGALGLTGIKILSGCEHIEVTSKVAGEMVDYITPAEDGVWYWQSGNGTAKDDAPEISRDAWSLAIHDDEGQLDELSFGDLRSYADDGDEISYVKTMRCVFGRQVGTLFDSLVSTGIFKGVPVHRILESYDLSGDPAKLRTFGADGFESNIPMERALRSGTDPLPVILAYKLNGEPMPRLRGGPVRLVVPEMWGYKNMKWLTRLEATEDDSYFGTYETERFGGDDAQPIIDEPAKFALSSTVSRPAATRQEIEGPEITVAGTSFVGGAAIDTVELALDDGPFEPVDILDRQTARETIREEFRGPFEEAVQSDDEWPPANVWAVWARSFADVDQGEHVVTVRAADTDDRRQSSSTDNRYEIAPQVRVQFTVT